MNMQIRTNTDRNIEGSERLLSHVQAVVKQALERFSDRITTVEIHLSDENGDKGGHDKRCVMEARLGGRQPTAVTDQAATIEQAVAGAAAKLARSLGSTVDRLRGY